MVVDSGLAGRCGLYCGACGVYRGYKDGGQLIEDLSKRWDIPKDKFRCEGCIVLTPACWGSGCKIVKCLNEKGYLFCYQCHEFNSKSCKKYEILASRYLKRGEDIRASLTSLLEVGIERWLENQDRWWRCKECGMPVSVHASNCYACGQPLAVRGRDSRLCVL